MRAQGVGFGQARGEGLSDRRGVLTVPAAFGSSTITMPLLVFDWL
jgi:hypothetical protein